MNALDQFHFLRPYWLVLVPGVVWLWSARRRRLDPLRGWRAVMQRELLQAVVVSSAPRSTLRDAMLLIGWLVAILAVAGPTWRPEPLPFADDPVAVMIVLKADETMELDDLAPSRMERAQLKVADFALQRKGKPLGLVAYAGSAHLVLPPTDDTEVVAEMGQQISPQIMPRPGDALASALQLADEALGDSGGALLVVADQVDSGEQTSLEAWAASSRNPVFFLAVARPDTPELDKARQAAATLRAEFAPISADESDVRKLARQIGRLSATRSEPNESERWDEAGRWLVAPLALLSLAGFRRKKRPELSEGMA